MTSHRQTWRQRGLESRSSSLTGLGAWADASLKAKTDGGLCGGAPNELGISGGGGMYLPRKGEPWMATFLASETHFPQGQAELSSGEQYSSALRTTPVSCRLNTWDILCYEIPILEVKKQPLRHFITPSGRIANSEMVLFRIRSFTPCLRAERYFYTVSW